MDDKIRIVIADDHAGLRHDVTQLIESDPHNSEL